MFDYVPFPVFTHTTGMTHFQVDGLSDVMATDVVGPPMKWVSHEIRHN